jgi:hypothetical protein
MTQGKNSNAVPAKMSAYGKPMLIGGAIALIMICMFVFTVKEAPPEWGMLWMIQPLIVSPLVGAMGGLFYFLVNFYGAKRGLQKYLTVTVGLIGFIISLWMSIVLGLHGTMWN